MTPDDFSSILDVTRYGAAQEASGQPDEVQHGIVADLLGECLEHGDLTALRLFEGRVRSEASACLPWFLRILRTLAGTTRFGGLQHHLVFVPIFSKEALDQKLEIGEARHEIEGSLEQALNLGQGTLRLLPTAAPWEALETMTPVDWWRLNHEDQDSDAPLCRARFGAHGGALVGRWSVDQGDKPRLSRKLMHAMQRTPALVSWQQRSTALLEERAPGSSLVLGPAWQLQDFYMGFRRSRLRRALDAALQQVSLADRLTWSWIDTDVVCNLKNAKDEHCRVRSAFPDEPRSAVRDVLKAFCARQALRAEPELTAGREVARTRRAVLH